MLGVHTLQSTSDQQDPVLYAAISAALPTAVLPEQGAHGHTRSRAGLTRSMR